MHPNIDFDFISTFVRGLSSFEVIISVIGFVSASAFAGLWVTRIGSWILPHPRESRVSDFLPFDKLLSDGITIKCQNSTLLRVFRVTGADLSMVVGEKVASMGEARKSWIDDMADLSIGCRVITLREKIPFEDADADFGNLLLEQVSETWKSNLNRVYSNQHFIVLSVPDRNKAIQDLNHASQSLLATLDEYGVKTMYETIDSDPKDSPFYLYSKICSPITRPSPKIGNTDGLRLRDLLTADHIHFTGEEGVIKFFSGMKEKYAITMGIRACGDFMDESMVMSLLAIDCELNLLHNFNPISKTKARALLMQQRRMAEITSFSGAVVEQYSEAMAYIEDSDADYQSLVEYAMSVVVYGETMEEIEFGEAEVQRICRLFGVTPVREGWVT